MKARAEAFELREQLKLLHDEIAQSRLLVDRTKNSVMFNTSKKSYWECDKASRSQKRKKIRGLMLNAVEKLPKEFKSVKVSLWHDLLLFITEPSKRKMIVLNSFTFIPHASTGKILRVWPGIDNPLGEYGRNWRQRWWWLHHWSSQTHTCSEGSGPR